ncbi:MAG: UbiA family prenyltransferase [Patescibacteria group bacterium]
MLKKWLQKIENSQISFWQIFFLIYVASFFRNFLENYANSYGEGFMTGIIDTFFHFPLWFSAVFLSSFILLKIITKEKIEKISRLGAFFSFIILIPPIADLLLNNKNIYSFGTGSVEQLIKSFIYFWGDNPGVKFGWGIKIEVAIVLLSVGYYIFLKTKKIGRSLIGIIILYSIIYSFTILPTFVFAVKNTLSNNPQEISVTSIYNFFYKQEPSISTTNYRSFISDLSKFKPLAKQDTEKNFSITLSIILLLIDAMLLSWCFFFYDSKKLFSSLKNFRYLRIVYYYSLIFIGMILGIKLGKLDNQTIFGSLFDIVSLVSLFSAFLFAWLFAVWENDEEDIGIDEISNKNRPLVKKEISTNEWKSIKYLFLFFSLNFAFLSGFYTFIFILIFMAIYHIYSAQPLRLKRFMIISSLLIAINALLAVLAGFFFTVGTENLNVFPFKYALCIIGVVFLVENVKNLKDIEGDKKYGIKTLPVILGEKKSKLLIGTFFFFSMILVSFVFFLNIWTFFTAGLFGLILFLLINKEKFEEKYIFLAYFVFLIIFIIEIFYLSNSTL